MQELNVPDSCGMPMEWDFFEIRHCPVPLNIRSHGAYFRNSMIDPPLRLLFAEDSDDDAREIFGVLANDGYELICTRVSSMGQFRSALETGQFNLILSEYAMPEFSATEALAILRESGRDIPLIIVSGTCGDATAVEVMRQGAADYVLKENLIRLAAIVARELREADTRRQRLLLDQFALSQTEIMEMILHDEPLDLILERLVGVVEMLSADEVLCTIMRVSADGRNLVWGVGAEPLRGMFQTLGPVTIGPGIGSCGTAAALGKNVIVEDVTTHPDWSLFREITQKQGLGACWSVPIFASDRRVLGTMSVYHRVRHLPTPEELRWVESASKLASIAMERQVNAEKLAASEGLLRIASEAGRIGGWTVDFPERQIAWSDQVCAIHDMPLGCAPDFDGALAFYAPEWRAKVAEVFEQCLRDGKSFDEEMEIITAQGRRIWVRVVGERIQKQSEPAMRIQGACQDITRRKHAQAESARIYERLIGTIENISDAFFTLDRDWYFTYLNPRAQEVLRLEQDQLLGKNIWEKFVDLENSDCGCGLRRALAENCAVNLVDFSPLLGRWFEIRAYPAEDGLAVYFYDVTERRKEQELLQILEKSVSRINDLVIITTGHPLDEPGPNILFVNDAFERHTGYSREEVIGKSPRFLQGPKTQADRLDLIRAALRQGASVRTELINYKKGGEEFWLELEIVPVLGSQGAITHFVAVERDITQRKRAEETILANEIRYLSQRNALIMLTKTNPAGGFDRKVAFQRIIETTAKTLNVARVSIWRYTEDRQAIECMCLFQLDNGEFDSGARLTAADYPAYFKGLAEMELISADDAHRDPVTREFSENYLSPLGISSMMDVPIRSQNAVNYVLCNEHIGEARQWTQDEKTFAFAIANLIALALEISERAKAQNEFLRSHQRFQSVAAATNDTIWDWNLESDAFWWNDGFANLFGWASNEIDASIRAWIRQIHPEDRGRVVDGIYAAIARGDSHWSDEYRFISNHGKTANVLDRGEVIRDAAGKAIRMVGGMTDLTRQKSAEIELSRSHRALQMLSSCNEMLIRTSLESDLLAEACRIAVEIGGYRMAWVGYAAEDESCRIIPVASAGEELGYLSEIEVSWAEDRSSGAGPVGRAIRSGQSVVIEDVTVDPGFADWLESATRRGYRSVVCLPLSNPQRPFGVLCLYAAEPHPAGAEELQLLKEMANDLAFGIESCRNRLERQRTQDVVVKVAQAVSSGTGSEFFDLLTRNMVEALGAHGGLIGRYHAGENTVDTLSYVLDGRQMESVSYTLAGTPCESVALGDLCVYEQGVQQLFPDDHLLAVLGVEAYVGIPLRHQDGSVGGIMVVFFSSQLKESALVQSTLRIFATRAAAELDRQSADARIREQASLLDKAQDAILVRDLNHTITYWNKSAERLYGWTAEEAIGQSVEALLYRTNTEFARAHELTLSAGEWVGEMTQIDKEGREITIEARWNLVRNEQGVPVCVFAINTDISEHRKLEQQFLRAQRLESIGTLAGGIAHDLNNILAPISMAIELLRMRGPDERSSELLDTIGSSAKRGADMVGQVLSFARGMEGLRVEVRPHRLIMEIEGILRDTFLRNVEMQVLASRDLWAIRGDPTQLHQVLLNLCVNARDAIAEGGSIFISGENVQIDATFAAMNLAAKEGPHVCVEVRDTGEGIPAELMDRIFDPFFTTKSVGKGTGLGLSTSLAIVKSHGGFIFASSDPGDGTRFRVYLPASPVGKGPDVARSEQGLQEGKGEMILIVDDEPSIRKVTQQTLDALGYRTCLAANGAEAISRYADAPSEIDVVLTDMMMPIMDGPETIRRLLAINPAVRIIATSGVTATRELAEISENGVKNFLPKPYTAEELVACLRQALSDELE